MQGLYITSKNNLSQSTEDVESLRMHNQNLTQQVNDLSNALSELKANASADRQRLYYFKEVEMQGLNMQYFQLHQQGKNVYGQSPVIRTLNLTDNSLQAFESNNLPNLEWLDLRRNGKLLRFQNNLLVNLSQFYFGTWYLIKILLLCSHL